MVTSLQGRRAGALIVGLILAATVKDLATYESPARDSMGMQSVLVNGVLVVRDGKPLDGVFPGRGVRAPRLSPSVPTR